MPALGARQRPHRPSSRPACRSKSGHGSSSPTQYQLNRQRPRRAQRRRRFVRPAGARAEPRCGRRPVRRGGRLFSPRRTPAVSAWPRQPADRSDELICGGHRVSVFSFGEALVELAARLAEGTGVPSDVRPRVAFTAEPAGDVPERVALRAEILPTDLVPAARHRNGRAPASAHCAEPRSASSLPPRSPCQPGARSEPA